MSLAGPFRAMQRGRQIARRVGVQNAGMYVALPANRTCISEPGRDDIHGSDDALSGDPLVLRGPELGQRARGEDGARPRAEVFRRQIFIRNVTQVGVHVVRTDRSQLTVLIPVLEELLPR